MRSAAVVCALVSASASTSACYRAPAFDTTDGCAIRCGTDNACPSDRKCSAGFCLLGGESACAQGLDAPSPFADGPDGPTTEAGPWSGTACTANLYASAQVSGANQTSFTSDGANTVAVYATNDVRYDGLSMWQGYLLPRLAAGGNEVFMEDSGGKLVHVVFDSHTGWSSPQQVTMTGVPGAFFPGTATATSPRRMMISSGQSTFLEASEDDSGAWAFEPLAPFAGLSTYQEPSLSNDGLRLVFLGKVLGSPQQIFVSTRASVDTPFSNPTSIFNFATFSGTPYSPFLPSDNCNGVYFDDGTSTYRAGLQP